MSFPGGKGGSGVYQQLINLMPPHRRYVEPFLGGGAVMRIKRPAEVSLGIDIDPAVVSRWSTHGRPGPAVICDDGLRFLAEDRHLTSDTLVYCDPPYLIATRSTQRPMYEHEFNEFQHTQLCAILRELRCMVMLSGYANLLYNQLLHDWNTHTFTTTDRRGNVKTEKVWFNFSPPAVLHDWRFLGKDYRDRERIRRMHRRWERKFQGLTEEEKGAMLSVLQQLGAPLTYRPMLIHQFDLTPRADSADRDVTGPTSDIAVSAGEQRQFRR
jgi:DNA adenine methylase